MAITSASIYTGARALLNDQGTALFTNATLEPLLQICLRDLEAAVVLEDGPLIDTYSTEATITANASGGNWAAQPTDIIYPMKMEERAVGATLNTDWVDMTFKEVFPNEIADTTLRYWGWRQEQIIFLGATVDRRVRLYYKRLIVTTPSTGVISGILQYAENYLEFHLAELAAATIGQNMDIASAMGQYAAIKMEELLGIISKHNQKVPIRRKGYTKKFRRIWG